VLPSRREGFGNVVIEAMAAGAPVLATRGGGPEALIRDRLNGFLVAPGDPAALAAAIAALLRDPAARTAAREPARATAAGYTVAASTRSLELLLDRLGKTGSPRS
jgi:glycosyltransferase involved in cell wall biosynthesis